jgi:hypothetical protein
MTKSWMDAICPDHHAEWESYATQRGEAQMAPETRPRCWADGSCPTPIRCYLDNRCRKRWHESRSLADNVCRAVAELPDRTSPTDWPEAMLVTHDELFDIVIECLRLAQVGEG